MPTLILILATITTTLATITTTDTHTMPRFPMESLKMSQMKFQASLTPPITPTQPHQIATMDTNTELTTLLKSALVARSTGPLSGGGWPTFSNGWLTFLE